MPKKKSKRKKGGNSCHQDGAGRMRGGGMRGGRMRGGGMFDGLFNAFSSGKEQLTRGAVGMKQSVTGAVGAVQAGVSQTGQDIGYRATNVRNMTVEGKTTEQLEEEKRREEERVATQTGLTAMGAPVEETSVATVGPPVVEMTEEDRRNKYLASTRQNGGRRRGTTKRRKTRRRKTRRRKTRRKSKKKRKRTRRRRNKTRRRVKNKIRNQIGCRKN